MTIPTKMTIRTTLWEDVQLAFKRSHWTPWEGEEGGWQVRIKYKTLGSKAFIVGQEIKPAWVSQKTFRPEESAP